MTRHEKVRLDDIEAAIDAIESHLQRGDLFDGLVFDAVRVRIIEIGEAVKQISPELLALVPEVSWQSIAGMRDWLAHRYFDTSHAILQATLDEDIPRLKKALTRMRQAVNGTED